MYKTLVGKSKARRPFGRQGRKCEDNIKVDLIDDAKM